MEKYKVKLETLDIELDGFVAYLKRNGISHTQLKYPIVEYVGSKDSLNKMIKKYWSEGMDKMEINEMIESIEQYRTGGVAKSKIPGNKHVDVVKGYRLPHGYRAVKGEDKNKNYSKGKPKVKVTPGWRLPKGYKAVDAAYNMKYEDGGMTSGYCYEIGGL